jgi:hypothetical protein
MVFIFIEIMFKYDKSHTQLNGGDVRNCDVRCSGMLRSVYWQLVADVSGQPVVPIFGVRHPFDDRT